MRAAADLLAGYRFERLHGAWWDRVVTGDGNEVPARSVARYLRFGRGTAAGVPPVTPAEHVRPGNCRNDPTSTVALTVAEIRRLLDALLPRPRPDRDHRQHALNWSYSRRHHQAIARHCHYRRRTSSEHDFSLEY
ncbi:hypothetical protein [Streptomyces sp. NRRL B-24484]|uniref:hypothetical protein n=1 Tax=Streptomyces sp. NRRL B-24484 TaxID=1463833 RepID=UPI0004BF1FA6|nr:hypothetical protein [Streptomyces sp. NRRL B-24484]